MTDAKNDTKNNNQICRHLFISGDVQNVGFRAHTQWKARELNVQGWVRNLSDGRVEALLWGAPDSVKQLEKWCHRGPSHARVTDVEAESGTPDDTSGFQIRND